MAQFSNQNVFDRSTGGDPVNTNIVTLTGTSATDSDYLIDVPAGGRGLVITMVAYTVTVAEGTTAQVLSFFRRITAGVAGTQRAVSINSGTAGGATTMTIPLGSAAGNVYRVFFGADAAQDHVLNPGESFAVQLVTAGTHATPASGVLTVHGYSFDVGPQIDVLGSTHLTAVAKDNANGTGSIFNLIA
jgi:hypothetical protein